MKPRTQIRADKRAKKLRKALDARFLQQLGVKPQPNQVMKVLRRNPLYPSHWPQEFIAP